MNEVNEGDYLQTDVEGDAIGRIEWLASEVRGEESSGDARRGGTVGDVLEWVQRKYPTVQVHGMRLGEATVRHIHGKLYVQGRVLPKTTRLAKLCCLTAPVPVWLSSSQTSSTPARDFRVKVKQLLGNKSELRVKLNEYERIVDVKRKIQKAGWEGLTLSIQRLVFGGKPMFENELVIDQGLVEDSEVSLILNLRGGASFSIRFADVTDDNGRITHNWSTECPAWRMVAPGLSLACMCWNAGCEARGYEVICNLQFGTFDLIVDSSFNWDIKGKCICPVCSGPVSPRRPGFNNCFFKLEGQKDSTRHPFMTPWEEAKDAFTTWDAVRTHSVGWQYLRLHARPTLRTTVAKFDFHFNKDEDHMTQVLKLTAEEDRVAVNAPMPTECALCMEGFGCKFPNELAGRKPFSCLHVFHELCADRWISVCSERGLCCKCPLCEANVEEK